MSENWRSYPIRELAANSPQSFTDGDWIEAPHIRETGIRLIQTGNIGIGSFIDRSRKYISQLSFDALHCKEIRPGDLLICRLAEPIGRACFAPDLGERMITSVDVTILRVDTQSFDPRFVSFCINTPECLRQCEALSGGTTRQRISRTNLGKVEIRAPGVAVQRRIAEILSTLDEAIEQTEALIAKHQQIKAGLMHDLFTRGVTPDGHLRPTREQAPDLYKQSLLGWIPKEWEIAEIQAISSLCIDCPHTTPVLSDEGYPMARTSEIRGGRLNIDLSPRVSRDQYLSRVSRGVPQEGDIVFTREAPVGEAFVVPPDEELCLGQRVMLIRPNRAGCQPEFFLFQLYSARVRREFDRIVGGTTNPHLNVEDVRRFKIFIPSLPEQERIASRLLSVTDRMITESKKHSKLRQQKYGLMRDLLAGRVRVPEDEKLAAVVV